MRVVCVFARCGVLCVWLFFVWCAVCVLCCVCSMLCVCDVLCVVLCGCVLVRSCVVCDVSFFKIGGLVKLKKSVLQQQILQYQNFIQLGKVICVIKLTFHNFYDILVSRNLLLKKR